MEDVRGMDVLHVGRSSAALVPEDESAFVEVEDKYSVSQMLPVVTLPRNFPKTFKMMAQEHLDLDMDGL
jgi:hypothetical protein